MAKYQIDMYAAGLHRRGSKAVERYTNMEIRNLGLKLWDTSQIARW